MIAFNDNFRRIKNAFTAVDVNHLNAPGIGYRVPGFSCDGRSLRLHRATTSSKAEHDN